MAASAQIAVYPLRQQHLSPAVNAVAHALDAHGLHVETGPMSTRVVGEADAIFAALGEAFARAAETPPWARLPRRWNIGCCSTWRDR